VRIRLIVSAGEPTRHDARGEETGLESRIHLVADPASGPPYNRRTRRRDGTIMVECDGRRWCVVGRQIATDRSDADEARSKPRSDADAKPAGRRISINTATDR
jgi:hypothetical protein